MIWVAISAVVFLVLTAGVMATVRWLVGGEKPTPHHEKCDCMTCGRKAVERHLRERNSR